MPAVSPLRTVTPRDWLQLNIQIPPAVVAIVPPVRPAEMSGAPITGALGSHVPFAQSQRTERSSVILLAEFGDPD